jgi:choline dehydrogenase-like flavoprotein
MRTRLLFAALGVAVAAAFAAPQAGAQVPAGDSVTGSGTVEFFTVGVPGSITTPFEFNVHSGPSGENPTGQVSFAGLSVSAPVTCLDVRTVPFAPPFNQATMNLVTSQFGLVTLQVSDGNPEGLPDFISALTFSARSPTDCSPLGFGSENVRGAVLTGDIDIVNAPPFPTSKEQCIDGGYVQYGFKNQGECMAFVQRGPKT